MATTKEKMGALGAELRETAIEDTSPETRPLVELVQIGAGFGIDVFSWLVPGDDSECDVFIDQLIALLFRVRGDDLPTFDPGLYGEAGLNDAAPTA